MKVIPSIYIVSNVDKIQKAENKKKERCFFRKIYAIARLSINSTQVNLNIAEVVIPKYSPELKGITTFAIFKFACFVFKLSLTMTLILPKWNTFLVSLVRFSLHFVYIGDNANIRHHLHPLRKSKVFT